jgi:hypothetical protein
MFTIIEIVMVFSAVVAASDSSPCHRPGREIE